MLVEEAVGLVVTMSEIGINRLLLNVNRRKVDYFGALHLGHLPPPACAGGGVIASVSV